MRIFQLTRNTIKEVTEEKISKTGIVWIRSIAPDANEIQRLQKISGIPLEELQESIEEEERPRLSKKKYVEIIYDAPHYYKGEGLQTMEVYFYLAKRFIITIEEEPSKVFSKIEAKCKENRSKFIFESQGAFLFHVLDEINDEFLARIDRVARNLDPLKRRELRNVDIDTLSQASITLAYFNQAILANVEVLNQLRKAHHKTITSEDRENFNELYIDKLQILDTEKVQRELVMHLISIQSIRSTERLNHTMKRLTGLALLIAVPTLVTSMYGMNIPLPFQDQAHSFAIIIGSTIIVSLALLWYMHKKEWV